MAETLSTISFISFVAAGVFFVAAAVMWFAFKIPMIIGDLSGRNARKSIKKMRISNEGVKRMPDKKRKAKAASKIDGKGAGKKSKGGKHELGKNYETGLLAGDKAISVSVNATEALTGDGETELLHDGDATEVLREKTACQGEGRAGGIEVTVLEEVVFVHTKEVIQ